MTERRFTHDADAELRGIEAMRESMRGIKHAAGLLRGSIVQLYGSGIQIAEELDTAVHSLARVDALAAERAREVQSLIESNECLRRTFGG